MEKCGYCYSGATRGSSRDPNHSVPETTRRTSEAFSVQSRLSKRWLSVSESGLVAYGPSSDKKPSSSDPCMPGSKSVAGPVSTMLPSHARLLLAQKTRETLRYTPVGPFPPANPLVFRFLTGTSRRTREPSLHGQEANAKHAFHELHSPLDLTQRHSSLKLLHAGVGHLRVAEVQNNKVLQTLKLFE